MARSLRVSSHAPASVGLCSADSAAQSEHARRPPCAAAELDRTDDDGALAAAHGLTDLVKVRGVFHDQNVSLQQTHMTVQRVGAFVVIAVRHLTGLHGN